MRTKERVTSIHIHPSPSTQTPLTPREKNSLFFLHKVVFKRESCCRYRLRHYFKDENTLARLMARKMLWLWLLIIPGYLFKHVLWLFYKLPAGGWLVFRRQDNPGLGCLKLQYQFAWQVGVSQSRVHGRKNTGLSFICSKDMTHTFWLRIGTISLVTKMERPAICVAITVYLKLQSLLALPGAQDPLL